VSDDNDSPEPEATREAEGGADRAQDDNAGGVVVHLNDIIRQANEDKRSLDEMLRDVRPWAQINPTREMAESINKLLSSWRVQNLELFSAVSPLNTATIDAIRASVTGLSGLNRSVVDAFGGAQGGLVTQAVSAAVGALNEAGRSFSALGDLRNRPGFATGTQRFLATTEYLRYGAGKTVWHYTSGYVLMQVLSKNYLWASIPHNLNDSSEVKHGLDIIRKAFKDALAELDSKPEFSQGGTARYREAVEQILDDSFFEEVLNEIYIISASGNPDSLTLWRNYSGGDGFAIGINSGATLSADGIPESPEARQAEAKDGIPPIRGWYKVVYPDAKKKDLADRFVADALEDLRKAAPMNRSKLLKEQRKHILILASTMKHKAFADEKEVRWMTTNWMPVDVMPQGSVVHYEHTPQGIVPVLHVRTASEDKEQHLPIKGIRCSPASREGIERTIRGLLMQHGYEAAKNVSKSQQPYKG
jgi:hypothetical protein